MNGDRLNSKQLYIVHSALVCSQERKNNIMGLRLAEPYSNLASMKSIKTCNACKAMLIYAVTGSEHREHIKLQPVHTRQRTG